MSTLSQFVGGGIKSIQTGSTSSGSGATINAVNTSKSFVLMRGYSDGGISTSNATVTLTNSTTVTVTGAATTTIAWSVIEFY